ncbi:cystatin-1-like [Panonychus citri]|uniref:cystatin-1-like n=1 Tax=Panonychus citri TaxID=50023 RepID=UPI0023077921|nr:cystatin-1-like [Panonychus citri]
MILLIRNLFLLITFAYLVSSRIDKVGRLVGGWSPKDVNHESVKENAKFATKTLNDRSNDAHYENLIHIHEALSQVVSGVKYNITMDIGKTTCRKNEVESDKLEQCSLDQKSTIKRCKITVLSRPWLNETRLLHSECSPFLNYPEYFNEKRIAEDKAYHRIEEAPFM